MILLLAVYAFRINEVSKLTIDDIDWEAERLHVRRSKLKKVEEYPLATEVGTAIVRYLKEVRPSSSRRELFLTLRAPYRPLSAASLGARVGTLVRLLGIKLAHWLRTEVGIRRFDGGRFQPRLHDFRHTFAVRRLISWYREGKNVQRLLPHLSTYLGHVDIDSTAHYLTMTHELLQEANRCFEIYASAGVRHG